MVDLSTAILAPLFIVPFLVVFIGYYKFKHYPILIEMLLLKLAPSSGKTRAFFIHPQNVKQDYIEIDRGDGVLELYDFEGQASMVIETARGFDYIYMNPEGTKRILSPMEVSGKKRIGDYSDAKDLAMEQITAIHHASRLRPQAGILMLLLSLGAGIGLIFLLHLVHLL